MRNEGWGMENEEWEMGNQKIVEIVVNAELIFFSG